MPSIFVVTAGESCGVPACGWPDGINGKIESDYFPWLNRKLIIASVVNRWRSDPRRIE
jgi:hypothetical protein